MNDLVPPPKDPAQGKPEAPQGEPSKSLTIHGVANAFIRDVNSIAYAYPVTMLGFHGAMKKCAEEFGLIFNKYGDADEMEQAHKQGLKRAKISLTIPGDEVSAVQRKMRHFAQVFGGSMLVKRSFISSLVSQYDAFFGDLLRAIIKKRPDIINVSERPLTFVQLSEFASIEEARDHIVEREIDTVLRDSHADQFSWLGKKFAINAQTHHAY